MAVDRNTVWSRGERAHDGGGGVKRNVVLEDVGYSFMEVSRVG